MSFENIKIANSKPNLSKFKNFYMPLSANLKNLAARYVQNKSLIIKYQRTILPNTNLLIETASKKLNAGEIGYLEWVMIINQAIQIQNEYFNYVQQLNEGAIEIEKITANN